MISTHNLPPLEPSLSISTEIGETICWSMDRSTSWSWSKSLSPILAGVSSSDCYSASVTIIFPSDGYSHDYYLLPHIYVHAYFQSRRHYYVFLLFFYIISDIDRNNIIPLNVMFLHFPFSSSTSKSGRITIIIHILILMIVFILIFILVHTAASQVAPPYRQNVADKRLHGRRQDKVVLACVARKIKEFLFCGYGRSVLQRRSFRTIEEMLVLCE